MKKGEAGSPSERTPHALPKYYTLVSASFQNCLQGNLNSKESCNSSLVQLWRWWSCHPWSIHGGQYSVLRAAGPPGDFITVTLLSLAPGAPVSNGHTLLARPRFAGDTQYIYHLLPACSLESTDVTQFSGKKKKWWRKEWLVTKAVSRIFSAAFHGNGVEIESHDCLIRTTFAIFPFVVRCDQVTKSIPMEFEWKYFSYELGPLGQ